MKGVILLGCGPKVGKTHAAIALIRALKRRNVNPGYFKFACTGCTSLDDSEAAQVQQACNLDQELTEMVPYFYKQNLPVHLAARESNRFVSPSKVSERFAWNLATHSHMVVEGLGDIISPITMEEDSVLLQDDLIRRMRLGTILVVKMGASALSQCALAMYYLNNNGLNPRGIIVNGYDETNFSHCDGCRLIERFCQTKIIGTIARNVNTINLLCDVDDLFFGGSHEEEVDY